ncbi:DUF7009 family protein [Foetidibacter luteolus]|uniref:DUF7009 family protein n=1 Tax=Foetidibacter luteolus TaxID=2608880 RepID=UPI00129A726F|nr:hypothetical protein [Foetidibacter luteolus]
MKLRFEKNSIRYRIKKSELLLLKENGFVKDEVAFPAATLTYELRIADVPALLAEISNNNICIHIPSPVAISWMETDEVGIYHSLPIKGREALDIVIEKDFPCKDRPGEDKSDTFTELVDTGTAGKVC